MHQDAELLETHLPRLLPVHHREQGFTLLNAHLLPQRFGNIQHVLRSYEPLVLAIIFPKRLFQVHSGFGLRRVAADHPDESIEGEPSQSLFIVLSDQVVHGLDIGIEIVAEECLLEVVGIEQPHLIGVVVIECFLDHDDVGFVEFPRDVEVGLKLFHRPLLLE